MIERSPVPGVPCPPHRGRSAGWFQSPCSSSSPGSSSEVPSARTPSKLGEVSTNDQASFLPRSAESTKVIDAQKAFSGKETVPAVVVWTSAEDGAELGAEQQKAATAALASAGDGPGAAGGVSPRCCPRTAKRSKASSS